MIGKYRRITKDQFCEKTGIKRDSWIFEGVTEPHFFEDVYKYETVYYFDNGRGAMRKFKYMPEFGEIWQAVRYNGRGNPWSIWTTWAFV